MDDAGFDRIVKALAAKGVRREALKASVVGVAAGAAANFGRDAEAKKKRKKKKKKKTGCKGFTASCASNAECCGAEFGVVACRAHPAALDTCAADFPGFRCCGVEGVFCNPDRGNCDCCDSLVCLLAGAGEFRCQLMEP